jgi:hypothetical protein
MTEHADHPYNLPAMHGGVAEYMPQNLPAREAPLNPSGKLEHQFFL